MNKIDEYVGQAQEYARRAQSAADPDERKRMIRCANDLLLLANDEERANHMLHSPAKA